MVGSPGSATVQLLAAHTYLTTAVGELRWREWGHAPEPEDRAWWIAATAREAGHDRLPITWVAIDGSGDAAGAVGLGACDIDERRDRSPWVLGMIVRPACRGMGIGRLLLSHLEAWAGSRGYRQVWVANEGLAVGFYEHCGWALHETIARASGKTVSVLTKRL